MLAYVRKFIPGWATALFPTPWKLNCGWSPGRIWRGRSSTKNISSRTAPSLSAVMLVNCSLPAPASVYFTDINTSTTTTIASEVSITETPASEMGDSVNGASYSDLEFINQSNNDPLSDNPDTHRRRSCRIQALRNQGVHFPLKKQNLVKKLKKTNKSSSPILLGGSKTRSVKRSTKSRRSAAGYRCPYSSCNFKHEHLHLLKNHLGTVHNETRFNCRTCQKEFKHQGTLSRHVRTHRESKKLLCSFLSCNFSSFRSDDLRKHERIHTGDKPFLCEYCPFMCNQRQNLKSHAKRRHTMKV